MITMENEIEKHNVEEITKIYDILIDIAKRLNEIEKKLEEDEK